MLLCMIVAVEFVVRHFVDSGCRNSFSPGVRTSRFGFVTCGFSCVLRVFARAFHKTASRRCGNGHGFDPLNILAGLFLSFRFVFLS